jgi:lipopolysaccharide/colanic/teichoic acid biosynthesis glycosyltransferase
MISNGTPLPAADTSPTLWGLNPLQVHDRFWAARGVQVVRPGEPSDIVRDAELFLLTDNNTLCVFKLTRLVEYMGWMKPDVLYIRLRDGRERGYRERVITGAGDRFVRFERLYGGLDSRHIRVALTPDPRIAHLWQKAHSVRDAWRRIRQEIPRGLRAVQSQQASVYDRHEDAEVMQCMRELVRVWKRPDSTVTRARQLGESSWRDESARIPAAARLIGPVWIGAGRELSDAASIVGPQVLWDDPEARPQVETLQWHEIEPTLNFARPVTPRRRTSLSLAAKRGFDILFSLIVIVLTLPLYPLIMLAIWLEDGRPFFFRHKRETLGGREFGCVKFRSMRKDADEIKAKLQQQNQADGPQFFMEEDPRLTRVGKFIRKTYIDELPQFWNVLLGSMSIVGPRPSPFVENQYCPPWREARLSVRPGVTGLWQLKRTRRKGLDFQEWIRYDLEYVENMSWGMDLKVIWGTIQLVLKGLIRS